MFNSVQDFQLFGKEQLDAATRSAAAFSQGVQKLLAETTELSTKSFETGSEALRTLMASKSLDRAVQVQMDYARTAYDSMLAGSTKLTGILSSTAQDVFKPLEGAVTKMQQAARGNVNA